MGLIKAISTSISKTLGDQFKEYVTCPELNNDTIVARGIVHHGEGNKNPSENIITNGSGIIVPESTAMIIVQNGKIVEFCAEAGTYTFNNETETSVFSGGFGKGLIEAIKKMGSRTTYGGATAQDERVYYVNLLVLLGNKFGSPQPKKITDDKYGMLEVTFFGEYAIKVDNPVTLINNIIGSNTKDMVSFTDLLGSQFKSKFVEKLTEAITTVMRKEKIPFGDIGMYNSAMAEEMNNLLADDLISKYGLKITDISIADINLTTESMQRVSKIDDAQIFANRDMQSGLIASATADAMRSAASNENGAAVGFMGMNMAANSGASLLNSVNEGEKTLIIEDEAPTNNETSNLNFCPNCGTKVNGGNFCSNCGYKLK